MPYPMIRAARIACLLMLVLACTGTALAQSTPPRVPCSRPEFRQFDFWLGDWDVTTPDGKPAGHNLITRPLGDCVIQEHWTGAKGGRGESYNMFDRVGGKWHQTWVDDQGTYLQLEGGLLGQDMVLTGPDRVVQGKPHLDRITWKPVSADEVHQVWDVSEDHGKTWVTQFHGVYRRAAKGQ